MSIKFTCASRKDNGKVTVSINQLENHEFSDGVPAGLIDAMSRIIVTLLHNRKTYEILFVPNRFKNSNLRTVATTAATNTWPRGLRLPKVGRSVSYKVIGVTYV